jgi:tRNA A-37 threonylcarbamoyl transferase component Bud32
MSSGEAASANPQVGRPSDLDDRYELLEPIGSGGMAEVWKARDKRLGRQVAVKLLPSRAAADPSLRRRIEREARALAALSHPNILAVYDVDATGERPFLVTELVEGPDLHRYLEANGRLDADEAGQIAADILTAVGRAHDAGVVHGDLKPANILMSDHGPKVGDLGVSRILAEETGATTIAATPRCAAPEVFRGARPTAAADVYSAGCVLYEMLAGQPPFDGRNGWELASKHMDEPIPSVRRLRPDVSVDVDEAIRRAMSKDPRRRFRSAEEFADALHVEDATVPVSAATPVAQTERTETLPAPQNLAAVAVFGPFAGVWNRARRWPGRARHTLSRSRNARIATAIGLVVLLLVLPLSLRGGGNGVVVPDVRGAQYQAASVLLKLAGFHVKDVSFRPVDRGDGGKVLETIPAAGQKADRGTDIYIIASAMVQTPAPVSASDPMGPAQPRQPRGHKHGKDD